MTKASPDSALTPVDSTLAPLAGEQPAPRQGDPGEAGVVEAIGLPAAPKARIAGTWWLLAGAVITSTGVLMGMRYIGMKGGVSGKDIPFDKTLVEAANRPKRDHGAVIKDLNSSRVTQQVPGEHVKKNPFRLAEALDVTPPGTDAIDPSARLQSAEAEAKRKRELERAAAIKTELQGFKLQSVLGGKPPIARVSGKLVREGDKLGTLFVVKSIHGRTIDIECDGTPYEIGMSITDVTDPEQPD